MPRPGLEFLGTALAVALASAAATAQTRALDGFPASAGYIVVHRGEYLSQIARDHGIPIQVLIAANRLRPPYTLRVGQRLAIPSPPAQQAQPPVAAPAPPPMPAAALARAASPAPPDAATAPPRPLPGPAADPAPDEAPGPEAASPPVSTGADAGAAPGRNSDPSIPRAGSRSFLAKSAKTVPVSNEIPPFLLAVGELMAVAAALWFVTR